MRKIKTDEIAITKLLQEQNQQTLDAFKLMSICIYAYDEVFNSNHLKNVKKIYLNRKNENLVKISDSLNTDGRSLTRHRKKYLKCFHVCEKIVKNLSEFFNFLNKLT